jgi:Cu(I)/Ag(I) efflux system membrane protein CusA/SilA
MVPMAIPSFGGMTIQILAMLIVSVLYSLIQEICVRRTAAVAAAAPETAVS